MAQVVTTFAHSAVISKELDPALRETMLMWMGKEMYRNFFNTYPNATVYKINKPKFFELALCDTIGPRFYPVTQIIMSLEFTEETTA